MMSRVIKVRKKFANAWSVVIYHYRRNKNLVNTLLIPLVLAILPICIPDKKTYCAYVVMLMSIFWVLQCVPIALTSLMPIFLFPIFGIMDAKSISPYYFADNVMFVFASVVIGIGIEASGLHKKIALRICTIVGSEPKWLLLGIMCACGFLSLWIPNTATVTMIYPIVISIVKRIATLNPEFSGHQPNQFELEHVESSANLVENDIASVVVQNPLSIEEEIQQVIIDEEEEEAAAAVAAAAATTTTERRSGSVREHDDPFKTDSAKNLIKCFSLSITYSATICGTASLIGTNANIVFKGYFEQIHPDGVLNFLTFLIFSTPITIINLIVCWVLLCIIWLPKGMFISFKKDPVRERYRQSVQKTINALVKHEYEKLGPYTWEQISVTILFMTTVLLWVTRDLVFVSGWADLFVKGFINSDTPAGLFMVFVAMLWPKENIFKGHEYRPLMTWEEVQSTFQWSLIFLVGGSIVMAHGCDVSGLSTWFGDFLEGILPTQLPTLCLVIIGLFTIIGTEFVSNVSMVSIILPILEILSEDSGISYYYLMIPQALSASFSYMLPAASPSNLIVFARGHLTLKDFLLTGLLLKLLNYGVVFVASNTYLDIIFPSPYGNNQTIFTTTTQMPSTTTTTTAITTTIINATSVLLSTESGDAVNSSTFFY